MSKPVKLLLTPKLLLSAGLAFVFAYAAYGSLTHPQEWLGYVPAFLTHLATPLTLVRLIAVFELLLAVWLLSAKYHKYAALLSALMLAGIILTNWSQLIVTFRDVGLLCMALALFLE
jgi:hypothetical protein